MHELDFTNTSVEKISEAFFANSAVLLRNFIDCERLERLTELVNSLYFEVRDYHIRPSHLKTFGIPQFHEYLFSEKHKALLTNILGECYQVNRNTGTRRVSTFPDGETWMAPQGPHLDAFFHEFAFTVNFWIPFRRCGGDAPSLGVVRTPFDETLRYCGYDGGPAPNSPAGEWNFAAFDRSIVAMCDRANTTSLRSQFKERVWTPTYTVGDAMMLSNWTLHFTHASPGMTAGRSNLELRFSSNATLFDIMRAAADQASLVDSRGFVRPATSGGSRAACSWPRTPHGIFSRFAHRHRTFG